MNITVKKFCRRNWKSDEILAYFRTHLSADHSIVNCNNFFQLIWLVVVRDCMFVELLADFHPIVDVLVTVRPVLDAVQVGLGATRVALAIAQRALVTGASDFVHGAS